ncbi:uncharacterized protein K02A2.6-like [Pectinophora gossypiella]|uniref:uncharacterized protein K02A2.6-like n=1 Tax=Pectinophora gossypiella TaxID=13191 RepID=UPI00214F3871|nr:uncharacterized protein K02A2.6-like [Pectinophora gossypiella]
MPQDDNRTEKADFNVRPPKYFMPNNNENVARAWKLWLQQFEWYAIATLLAEKKPEVQVAVFMSCIGPDAAVIYNTFNLSDSEAKVLSTVKEKFTNYYTPKINETYERYMFNILNQKEGQSFDEFVTELRSKVKNCGYGTLEESLLLNTLRKEDEEKDEEGFVVSSLDVDRDVDVDDWYEQASMPNNVTVKFKLDSDALQKEDDLFEGIGCLKKYKYDIDLVDDPKLPICPARKIPHTIRQQVKEELDNMVQQKIIKPVMSSLIADIKNTEVSMDDVLVHAASREELEKNTQKVLEKFRKAGLKLNKEKCVFSTQEVKFLGHIVTSEGLKPDPEKIETITKIKRPENVKELQRFLGLITYMSKFIKNMADITNPLRQLLQKNIEWFWDQPQEEAFLKLKDLLKNPPVLGYYNPKAPILLSVDASSYACGGVLIQNDKPIAYCAKSFTKTEQGYSQLEKEANAILVACKKFHTYIWGCKDLTIESDHKPLETIFKRPLTDAPPRLQRMLYQILPYNPKVVYKKGSEMYVADTLSRDCESLSSEDLNPENLQICTIVPFTKPRREELENETEKCEELAELKKVILKGWPKTIEELPENLKKYWYYRETLSVYNNIIFKNDRVLVPKSMVPLVMKHCHLSHKGVQGTLRLARDNVFWPDMAKDLTEYIKTCKACAKIQKDNQMEPIVIQRAPERPWSTVATDLFHLKGKDYIVITDSFSGFFDFKELNGITSTNIIKELKSWFALFGIPDVLLSDGGSQYNCQEFKLFQKQWQFEHRISSPHFPRSNGLAERYVQEAKTLMKKCIEDNTDIQLALLHHRNTPRLDLGSPAQRLFNRRTKTLLPTNEKLFTPKVVRNITKKLNKIKENEKRNADKGKKENKEFISKEKVMLRQGHQQWVPAEIVMPEGHRSYRVQTEDGAMYRRNAWHLKNTATSLDINPNLFADSPTAVQEPVTNNPSVPAAPTLTQQAPPEEQTQTMQPAALTTAPESALTAPSRTTRSGRVVKTPNKYL